MTRSSVLRGLFPLDTNPANSSTAALFASFDPLIQRITAFVEDEDEQARARFVASAKEHFAAKQAGAVASEPGPSSPRASTSAAVFPSYSNGEAANDSDDAEEEDEERQTLMDAIWAIDNGFEQQLDREAASKARSQLGLLVKDLEVRRISKRAGEVPRSLIQ